MLLYNEKAMCCLENWLRTPMLWLTIIVSQLWFPFLYVMIVGTVVFGDFFSNLLAIITRIVVIGLTIAANTLADRAGEWIEHAIMRIITRAALLLLSVPLGILVGAFSPVLLTVAFLVYLCLSAFQLFR